MNWPSYEEWADKAEAIAQHHMADWSRSIYVLPNGEHVCMDDHMPRHWGKASWCCAWLPGLQFNCRVGYLEGPLMQFGFESYTQTGYYHPQWVDTPEETDPLKSAYLFAQQHERAQAHRPRA